MGFSPCRNAGAGASHRGGRGCQQCRRPERHDHRVVAFPEACRHSPPRPRHVVATAVVRSAAAQSGWLGLCCSGVGPGSGSGPLRGSPGFGRRAWSGRRHSVGGYDSGVSAGIAVDPGSDGDDRSRRSVVVGAADARAGHHRHRSDVLDDAAAGAVCRCRPRSCPLAGGMLPLDDPEHHRRHAQ